MRDFDVYKEATDYLLAPAKSSMSQPVQIHSTGVNVIHTLHEEGVMSLKGIPEVLKRGSGNQRRSSTEWTERRSRSYGVLRLLGEQGEGLALQMRSPVAFDYPYLAGHACMTVHMSVLLSLVSSAL